MWCALPFGHNAFAGQGRRIKYSVLMQAPSLCELQESGGEDHAEPEDGGVCDGCTVTGASAADEKRSHYAAS
jgi:hypothetical protein